MKLLLWGLVCLSLLALPRVSFCSFLLKLAAGNAWIAGPLAVGGASDMTLHLSKNTPGDSALFCQGRGQRPLSAGLARPNAVFAWHQGAVPALRASCRQH